MHFATAMEGWGGAGRGGGDRVQSTEYRVQSTAYTVQSTEYRVQISEYSVQSTEYRVQSTEYRIQSTEYRVQSTEYIIQSTEWVGFQTDFENNFNFLQKYIFRDPQTGTEHPTRGRGEGGYLPHFPVVVGIVSLPVLFCFRLDNYRYN
jgi:hypothetical protein